MNIKNLYTNNSSLIEYLQAKKLVKKFITNFSYAVLFEKVKI
jgi:hypothetical protein